MHVINFLVTFLWIKTNAALYFPRPTLHASSVNLLLRKVRYMLEGCIVNKRNVTRKLNMHSIIANHNLGQDVANKIERK